MTAPKEREEIQRLGWSDDGCAIVNHPNGEFMLYGQRLRHLKLAQIEVLEELRDDLLISGLDVPTLLITKAAALRKELEHG